MDFHELQSHLAWQMGFIYVLSFIPIKNSVCWVPGWRGPSPYICLLIYHRISGSWERRNMTIISHGISCHIAHTFAPKFSLWANYNASQCSGHILLTWINFNPSLVGQNGRHCPDEIFKCIFMNGKFFILIIISPKFVPTGPIDNKPALVWIMAWRRIGDKPLSEPMLTQFTDAYMRHLGELS